MIRHRHVSLLLSPKIGVAYFPRTDPGQLYIVLTAPSGTRVEVNEKFVQQVGQICREEVAKDLDLIVSNIGITSAEGASHRSAHENAATKVLFLFSASRPCLFPVKRFMLVAVHHVAMNPNRVSLAVVIALATMALGSYAQARTFIDQAGRSLEGEVVKVEGTMVTIKRASDGQVFTVPASTFSKADQAYIVGKGGGGAPPPAAPSTPGDAAASTGKEPSIFSVDLLSPAKEYLWVDEAWREGAECIQAKVSTTADISGKDLMLKAYFFAADGTLLDTLREPSSKADYNGGTVKSIAQFQKGKKYQVYFAVSDTIKSGAKKWKRAIVVFGHKGDFDAKIYPKDDIKKFDFPEKRFISAARLSQ